MRNQKGIAKWMTGAALAGALLFGAQGKAEAQAAWGVSVGTYGAPVYAPPAYGYGDPYAYDAYRHQRWIEHEQREQWEAERAAQWRHEQWEREHFYDRDRGWHGDHDHDWHDRY